ncbi:MAG: hypothetical protein QN122_02190 [Armatimonadota bacterium]|nr:hypothetical protein [Armatimonadota bacterium]MDR7447879.1 hypothetical protein [Armatimonadota bacterium]MDR7459914.1 hypothetical protein [Armatimonadota bacterium]MDR7479773.1 hypothetical protein [Armatimonadota bacterium]MDR7487564.1 hypothetical protein [Armatimonadota bacterium]
MEAFTLSVVLGVAAGLLALLLAAFVLRVGWERRTNRILAAALITEGVAQSGGRLVFALPPAAASVFWAATPFAVGLFPFGYLLLLAVLQTPLVRWLRRPATRALLAGLGVAVGSASVLAIRASGPPGDRLAEQFPRWAFLIVNGVYAVIVMVVLFALVAAVDALRRAPPTSSLRPRARAFVLSFGLRDGLGALGLVLMIVGAAQGGVMIGREPAPLVLVGEVIVRLATIVAMPLLAYGILHTQLFDIDLQLRVGIRRGALVSAFVVVFFVASKLVEAYLSQAAGWYAGALAAGVLLFAAPRLNKLADRVAEATVPGPGTGPPAEYLAYRKLEVYKAAVETAAETGLIDQRERTFLARLRAKLGLAPETAAAVEEEVLAQVPAT